MDWPMNFTLEIHTMKPKDFAVVNGTTLTEDAFFTWLIFQQGVRKEYTESKRIQTIEYKTNSLCLCLCVKTFSHGHCLRSERFVNKEECKEAKAMKLIPEFTFI